MSKILPYVYKLTKPSTGEFYIGSRCKNKCPPEEDLGKIYFTSSKYVRPIFSEFEIEILAVFFESKWAYIYEQQLIFENWDNKLKLNRKYHLNSESLCVGPEHHSEATKRKMSISRKGIAKTPTCKENMKKGKTGKHPRPDVAERNKLRIGTWKNPCSGKPAPIVQCPHCQKTGSTSNIKRWHFENCKLVHPSGIEPLTFAL